MFLELKKYLFNINSTLQKHFEENQWNRNLAVLKFTTDFEKIYSQLTNVESVNSPKLTVYLWDNVKFIDYIKSIMAFNDLNLSQKLERILNTIKNHVVKFHHPTQSIVSNNIEIETLAQKKLRFSTLMLENVSYKIRLTS